MAKAWLLTGDVSMACVASQNMTKQNIIIGSLVAAFVVLAAMACLVAMRWQDILAELAQLRMNRVKRG